MSWRHLDGPEMTVQVTIGGTAIDAGTVVKASNDTVVAIGDGELVAGVLHNDGVANEVGVVMDLLVPGSVWEATVDTLTANREVKVAMSGVDAVDEGSTSDPAIGKIVNSKIASGDTKAEIFILGGTPTID